MHAHAADFGNAHWSGKNTGAGTTGPWAGADLENGMYYGGGSKTHVNNQSQPLTFDFVSIALKGRTDGFTIKGGDATAGKQTVMYDGPRPFEPDNTPGPPPPPVTGPAPLALEKCTVGNKRQAWSFEKNGVSISSGGDCLDIDNYAKSKGSTIWAYSCGKNSRDNEYWALHAGTIESLQKNTPFCLGTKGSTTSPGAGIALDSCGVTSSAFTVGFTNTSSGSGTIVQKASGLCVTVGASRGGGGRGYQPMKKRGAIILATGGDNSNSAKGNFYVRFRLDRSIFVQIRCSDVY